MESSPTDVTAQRLLQAGVLLFLLGLLSGFLVPAVANPRMGLAAHLQGILNGLFLLGLGLSWSRIALGRAASRATLALAGYGTFANWAATLLAAATGGGRSMPLAAGGRQTTAFVETTLDLLLFSLSAAMVAVCVLVLVGLRRRRLGAHGPGDSGSSTSGA